MLRLISSRSQPRKCDGTSRREFMRVGALGLAGFTLADVLRLQSAHAAENSPARKPRKVKGVILLFLDGGASQHETFDPKMQIGSEYRSLFGAVRTKLPGVEFGAQLPLMAGLADKMAIIRSLTHEDGDHGGATHWMKTGYAWPDEFKGKAPTIPQTHPSVGSVISRAIGANHPKTGTPTYVRVLSNHGGFPGDDAAWLGGAFAPFRHHPQRSSTMLENMELRVEQDRLSDRRTLLTQLDQLDRKIDQQGTMRGIDAFGQQAINVLRGDAKKAFDLSKEDPKTVAMYGPGLGEELLLARRLIEHGAGFVTLNNGYWDHHGGIIPGLKELTPPLDRAVSAYITDVESRGLFDDILLVVTGEFGRTPRINGGPGRDHYAPVNCGLFIGGGMKMGQVIGATDAKASIVTERPVTPQDYMATLMASLGIDYKIQFKDPAGRPRYMVENGQPIAELF